MVETAFQCYVTFNVALGPNSTVNSYTRVQCQT